MNLSVIFRNILNKDLFYPKQLNSFQNETTLKIHHVKDEIIIKRLSHGFLASL